MWRNSWELLYKPGTDAWLVCPVTPPTATLLNKLYQRYFSHKSVTWINNEMIFCWSKTAQMQKWWNNLLFLLQLEWIRWTSTNNSAQLLLPTSCCLSNMAARRAVTSPERPDSPTVLCRARTCYMLLAHRRWREYPVQCFSCFALTELRQIPHCVLQPPAQRAKTLQRRWRKRSRQVENTWRNDGRISFSSLSVWSYRNLLCLMTRQG